LFGQELASLRLGVNISHIRAEEALTEGNYRITQEWWDTFFQGRRGMPMGEVLAAASNDQLTSTYMAEVVISACYKLLRTGK
jgi:hypothetical protein